MAVISAIAKASKPESWSEDHRYCEREARTVSFVAGL